MLCVQQCSRYTQTWLLPSDAGLSMKEELHVLASTHPFDVILSAVSLVFG